MTRTSTNTVAITNTNTVAIATPAFGLLFCSCSLLLLLFFVSAFLWGLHCCGLNFCHQWLYLAYFAHKIQQVPQLSQWILHWNSAHPHLLVADWLDSRKKGSLLLVLVRDKGFWWWQLLGDKHAGDKWVVVETSDLTGWVAVEALTEWFMASWVWWA